MQVTESNATHCAVADMAEPLNLMAFFYWRAGEKGFRLVLKDDDLTEEYGAWDVETSDVLLSETLSNERLDHLMGTALHKFHSHNNGWTTDPVALAAHYTLEWGWNWTTERFASA